MSFFTPILSLVNGFLIEIGIAILIIPLIAAHLYVAIKAKKSGSAFWGYIFIMMLLGYMAGIGYLIFAATFFISFTLWPPSY